MSMHDRFPIDLSLPTEIPELHQVPEADEVSLFRRSGVGVVRGMFSLAEVEMIRAAFMDAAETGPVDGLSETNVEVKGQEDPLLRYPRMLHPHRHPEMPAGKIAFQYMLDPRIVSVLEAVTGEGSLAAQSMFYYKPPGSRGQGLHQDNNPLAVNPGTCMAAWIALDPCDAESGALSVVPGTGPLDLLCDVETEDRSDLFFNGGSLVLPEGVKPVTVEMAPGDVLFFNGQLIHGSYPNTSSDRWRRTLIFHYVPESCEEVAAFYHPLLNVNGQEVKRRASPSGGPCGEFKVSMSMMGS